MAFASLSFSDADSGDHPFEFSLLPPAPICSADDVFRGGIILPQTRSDDLRRRGRRHPQQPSAESLRFPRRAWGGGAPEKTEYRRLRAAADGQRTTTPRLHRHLLLGAAGPVPAATDMNEIRSRQRRARAAGSDWSRGMWRLLGLLSCRVMESDAVATAAPPMLASHVRRA